MTKFVMLFILPSLLALANTDVSDVGHVSEKLPEANESVLAGRQTTVIFHQKELRPSTEAVLIGFLKDLIDPVIITSRLDAYFGLHKSAMYSILLIDSLDNDALHVLESFNKRIIITPKKTFQAILDNCKNLTENRNRKQQKTENTGLMD